MPAATSTRTASPKRRARSSSSIGLQQVVGLVVEIVKSASRVTRKTCRLEDLHAREERVQVARDHVLERDEACARPPTGTKRGSISLGTFTRANVCTSVTGSRTITASDSERFEM